MIKHRPPNRLYRLLTTGQLGEIISYNEHGTVTVIFPADFNPMNREGLSLKVFGICPDDLEECDMPDEYKHLLKKYAKH
jgi:hypothetical protein